MGPDAKVRAHCASMEGSGMVKQPNKRRARKPRARTSALEAEPQANKVITIWAHDGDRVLEKAVTRTAAFERLAQKWNYILRARARWAADADLRASIGERALSDLMELGIERKFLQDLALVDGVEVELHPWNPADDDENRIYEAAAEVPWEYLISAATRSEGRFQSLLITRLFRNVSQATIPSPPEHVLFVESAPGRLKNEYEFDDEEERIGAAVDAVGPRQKNMKIMSTPQFDELEAEIRKHNWDAIHVTGVDTQQAAWCDSVEGLYDDIEHHNPIPGNQIFGPSRRLRDGMILREDNVSELPVAYNKLAEALVGGKKAPYVITLNLYYSGARTARELVRKGAHVALGFLDEIDDELAELFFQAFYWAWCHRDEHGKPLTIVAAFQNAWEKLQSDRLHGTSVVIWLGRSIYDQPGLQKNAYSASAARRGQTTTKKKEEGRAAYLNRAEAIAIDELIQVDLDVEPQVNYSLLHNNRNLLSKLTLTKLTKGRLEDITVHVELCVGAESYPYRYTVEVMDADELQLALASEVKIPLTANLPRALRERVQSTVYVKVTLGGRTACEQTKRITLIPVDEWLDDTVNNPWLPSFVLPRDPGILKIINASRRYLIGIIDDPAAGFDGYQEAAAGVDDQVQAIWTALVNEYRLQYINPPPAYSKTTQRLRTPTEILKSNTGTCIDLALLLASCLEYIGIYPVIVLLTGHAFVGYWRTEEKHDNLVSVENVPATVPAVGSPLGRQTAMPYVDQYGWRLTALNLDEILAYVRSGDLVMLEATFLTGAYSFKEAIKEGRANLRSRKEFDSLLDIQLARTATPPVTPLPIINE
jgi:hypothetical protein